MRTAQIILLPAALLALVLLPACGGGGGGGGAAPPGGVQPPGVLIASLQGVLLGSNETSVSDPDASASFLVEILDSGEIEFAATAQAGWVGAITGMHIHRGAPGTDGPIFVDLLSGGASFDAFTLTASDTLTISPALAAEIADRPADFYVNIHTAASPGGFVRGQLGATTTIELHAAMLGSSESTVIDPDARGAASFTIAADRTLDYVLAMGKPLIADVTAAHIHIGEAGVSGTILLGLEVASAAMDPGLGTLSGQLAVPLTTLAQILAAPGAFYVNAHTAAAPLGMVRGQLDGGPAEFWAPLKGDEETTVVDASARGGITLELESLTAGRAILAVPPAQGIDSVLAAHIHEATKGFDGNIVIDLMAGSDYVTSPPSGSSEGAINYDQTLFTRILANPAGFYANFHTSAAPAGLVRGQLTQNAVTLTAGLTGAEEVPIVDATASGTISTQFTGAHSLSFQIRMQNPPATDLIGAHIHDAPSGINGPILIDFLGGSNANVSGDSITGDTTFTGRTFARIMAAPELFYVNVHSPAAPAGVARGQLTHITDGVAPAGLTYTSPVTYGTGSLIQDNVPQSIGGAVQSYSVTPPLPAGLTLDPVTGIITGTPTAASTANNYTVTASNASGSTTATISITVQVGAPTNLQYTTPVTYTLGTAITANVPTSSGGAIASYSISPVLPAGLSLNTTTGAISGTPTAAATAANHTVTGTNAGGSTTFVVRIAVVATILAPSNLSYTTPVTYSTGVAIQGNSPTVGGGMPTSYSVSPALPGGLTLNTVNGVISGTPTAVTSAANYTVTAGNSAGSTTATVRITVTLGAPTSLSYSNTPSIGYVNGGIFTTMSPTVTGTVTSYTVSPGLPSGISISSTTGVISGSPTATSSSTSYTVTASNSAGSTTAQVSITILQ